MMEALKVMTYFKVSLSTHNWDSAIKKRAPWCPFFYLGESVVVQPPAGGDEGGEAAKQGARQHVQGPVHADQGA